MLLLPQKHVVAPKIGFFFGKNLHVVMMKKVTDRGFLAFWPFENEWKFRRKRKNAAKNLKFGKKWLSTTGTSPTKPWNVWTYPHHTSYCADRQSPIINTNCFIIHRCEFLFICFRTNLQLAHLLLNPGTYEHIRIIQVTVRITNPLLLIPPALSPIVVNFISF